MPLFGIQIFLSKAEAGRIHSHQIYTFVYVTEVLKHRRNPDVEIVATHVMSTSAKHITVNIGCKDITYHSSRYSSLAADAKNVPFMFMHCLSKSLHLARLTFLMLSQGAGHFRKADIGHVAHSSTGGSEVPAYDKCYILATDIYCNVFRTGQHYERFYT